MRLLLIHGCAAAVLLALPVAARTAGGACDGSAIAGLNGYLLAANDEDNVIRLYKPGAGSAPVRQFDLNPFLKPEQSKKGLPKEADIEAVARMGNRLYWIGSHGRDKDGKREQSRHRLFATDLPGHGEFTALTPVGEPFSGLLQSLLDGSSPEVVALAGAEPLAPAEGGISIEGMAAASDGSLLIGFRSPTVQGKALIIRIKNPEQVTAGGSAPVFDAPILLDMQGLGVRAMDRAGRSDDFWILAGPPAEGAVFRLYRWRAGRVPKPAGVRLPAKRGAPEGLSFDAKSGGLLVAMDQGDAGKPPCKERPVEQRSFDIETVKPAASRDNAAARQRR